MARLGDIVEAKVEGDELTLVVKLNPEGRRSGDGTGKSRLVASTGSMPTGVRYKGEKLTASVMAYIPWEE